MFDDFGEEGNFSWEDKLNEIEEGKYSPAEISSLFLRFKNKPKEALDNLHLIEKDPLVGKKKLFNKIKSEDKANNSPTSYNNLNNLEII